MKKDSARPLTILIDVDGILCGTHQNWIDWYNDKYDDHLMIEDLVWKLDEVVKPECGENIYDYIRQTNIYEDIPPLPGAIEAVQSFIDIGHRPVILTNPAGGYATIPDKGMWLDKYLPVEMSRADIIYTKLKSLIKADVFIDDSPDNLLRYREAWPAAHILTIAWPFNKSIDSIVNLRAKDWRDTTEAWREIVEYIEDI